MNLHGGGKLGRKGEHDRRVRAYPNMVVPKVTIENVLGVFWSACAHHQLSIPEGGRRKDPEGTDRTRERQKDRWVESKP